MAVSIEFMKSLDCANKIEATEYLKAYSQLLRDFETSNYGFIAKNFKPFPVQHGWAVEKLSQARITLGQLYWQLPYEEAARIHRGLTFKRWNEGVVKYSTHVTS